VNLGDREKNLNPKILLRLRTNKPPTIKAVKILYNGLIRLNFLQFMATLTDWISLLYTRVNSALPQFGKGGGKIPTRDVSTG
jgi:hypothetical protein